MRGPPRGEKIGDLGEDKSHNVRYPVTPHKPKPQYVKTLIMATGKREIRENVKSSELWGVGRYGEGRNMLGKILIEIRA